LPEFSVKDWNQYHQPVFSKEIIEYLDPKSGQVFFDGTLGLGGHASEILEKLGPKGKYIGVDQDQSALELAKERLNKYTDLCCFVHDNFRNIGRILKKLDIDTVDGIILDLGVSSVQVDDEHRGFSFRFDASLDMRMNQKQKRSCYDIVNTLSEDELAQIIKEYGEERFSKRIARRIVLERSKGAIESTKQLADIVLKVQPGQKNRQRIHPATRTFQALRIAVNEELVSLKEVLDECTAYLKVGARIAVISFHSLEDRIVKHKFRECVKEKKLKLIVKKPIRPHQDELDINPRARSAKLRIAERI